MRLFGLIIVLFPFLANAQVNPITSSDVSVLSPSTKVDRELIHLRTAYSKTFQNVNKTKTTQFSSAPIHYLSEKQEWLPIDYSVQERGHEWIYPSHAPIHVFNTQNTAIQLQNQGNKLQFKEVSFAFLDENLQLIDEKLFSSSTVSKEKQSLHSIDNQLLVAIDHQLYDQVRKTNYIIENKNFIPLNTQFVVLKNEIEFPDQWRIQIANGDATKVEIVDASGQNRFFVSPSVVSDSRSLTTKEKQLLQPKIATYEIHELGNKTELHTLIPIEWFTAQDIVYPVIIDPVVGNENDDVFGSCFFPNFLESELSVEVPEEEQILWSDIEYDYVATNGTFAWVSDQVSYVSSINGQTNNQSFTNDNPGTHTYSILNSEIANTTSTGEVSFTFHTSRDWGGSGCNTTFQFLNRRKVEVTYGTLSFGDGPIYINEYCIANRNNITGEFTGTSSVDNYNRSENWIELYNADPDHFFDLSGYFMSNDIEDPMMWEIQGALIPPASKVLVYASRRDISSGTVLHANFNLRQLRPDDIVLADPEGTIVEAYTIEKTQVNHSRGRITDGAEEWGLFTTPTPNLPNQNALVSYTSKPIIDVEAGVYENAISVSLSSENEAESIRYTLDGSTPTETSPLYENPLTLAETSVLRARCFSDEEGIVPGFIETNSYIIGEEHSLPIFSFAGDADLLLLFNGNDQLRPLGNFEYFDEEGTFVDENFGDFNKHGNDSWTYAQRGVDFISRDEFGYNRRLEHQFFSTSNRTRFRRLMVKAAANDNYPFETGGAHIRDSYIQTLSQVAKLDLDERSSTNIVLYVNGQYWGVYDLRERVDDNNYTDFYFNQDYTFSESDIYLQFLKTWGGTEAHFGNLPAIQDWNTLFGFVQNNNMALDANLAEVEATLNMDSFIDHFVLNSYVVSRDWLNYNTGWWRGLDPNGDAQKWRYIVWDMEAALGHFIDYTGLPDASANANPCQVENLNVGNGHAQILNKLITENPSVKERYVNRYIDLMNTHFKYENAVAVLDSMVANIAPEMPKQIERWGGNINTWENNVQNIRDFLQTRSTALVSGLMSCYDLTGPFDTQINALPSTGGKVRLNNEVLDHYPIEATLFGEINTYLTALPNPGYSFSHWVADGVVISPDLTASEISFMVSQATEITAHFENENLGDDTLIHYWHFNTLDTPEDITSVGSDFSEVNLSALITYTGSGNRDMDDYNNGSAINLYLGEAEGKALRVRNMSLGRSLVFDLPSTGYEDLTFSYAVYRSGQGMLQNLVSYSTNGVDFTSTGLVSSTFNITEEYQLIELNFSEIEAVNNNENLKIKIDFEGNTNQTNGNNRYDNISLKGKPVTLGISQVETPTFQVYPNPFTHRIEVISSSKVKGYKLYDVQGRLILEKKGLNEFKLSIEGLEHYPKGLYMLQLETEASVQSLKVIK